MEFLSAFIVAAVVVVLFVIFFIRSDADLTTRFVEIFGTPIAELKGKVVWITGASSGIGEYLAYELAAVGCKLVLSARRETELERVKERCIRHGSVASGDIVILPLDVLKFETHAPAVQQIVKKFTKIDVLVNNAGRSQVGRWKNTELEVDRQSLEINYLGGLSLSKAVLPHFLEHQSGHIVNVSSLTGKLGLAGSGSYSASKHALHGSFESLRPEVFLDNICITMVCPGYTFTNSLLNAFTETTGKPLGKEIKDTENRLATDRCSKLIAVAIANRLDEVWISLNPELLYTYMYQYMPTISRALISRLGKPRMERILADAYDNFN